MPPGPGDAFTDVIAAAVAGRTAYTMSPIQLALADIRADRLRALGVTTKQRSPLLPDVPTIAEAGVPGFDHPLWYGVWVPTGTPAAMVDKLAKGIARVLAAPELRPWLEAHGADRMRTTQPEFARFVLSESEKAARIAQAAGIKISMSSALSAVRRHAGTRRVAPLTAMAWRRRCDRSQG